MFGPEKRGSNHIVRAAPAERSNVVLEMLLHITCLPISMRYTKR